LDAPKSCRNQRRRTAIDWSNDLEPQIRAAVNRRASHLLNGDVVAAQMRLLKLL